MFLVNLKLCHLASKEMRSFTPDSATCVPVKLRILITSSRDKMARSKAYSSAEKPRNGRLYYSVFFFSSPLFLLVSTEMQTIAFKFATEYTAHSESVEDVLVSE